MTGQNSRRSSRRIRPVGAEAGSEYLPKKQSQTTSTRAIIRDELNRERYPVTGILCDISADYHVFSTVLGTGHYGCVRECRHRATGRACAVKSVVKSKARLDHLRREIYLLKKMDHRGIVKMVECYEDAEYVHIVTERYTGGELFDRISDETTPDGCLVEEAAADIIRSLLKTVVYLHNNDIVHRDIKPENILFESSREDAGIRLIDFGLSRRHLPGDAPMTNPVGTAYYMAPEVLKNRYGKACDVWSVGTIAYTLLCGYPPFNGESDPDIFSAIRKGRYRFPTRAWSSKSKQAKSFIKSLLAMDPGRRLTATEALNHPWIQGSRANSEDGKQDASAARANSEDGKHDATVLNLHLLRQTIRKPGGADDAKQEDATARIKALRQSIKKLRISVHPRAA